MTPNILRLLGILFMFAAAEVAVLNLHRVANLGLPLGNVLALCIWFGLHGILGSPGTFKTIAAASQLRVSFA